MLFAKGSNGLASLVLVGRGIGETQARLQIGKSSGLGAELVEDSSACQTLSCDAISTYFSPSGFRFAGTGIARLQLTRFGGSGSSFSACLVNKKVKNYFFCSIFFLLAHGTRARWRCECVPSQWQSRTGGGRIPSQGTFGAEYKGDYKHCDTSNNVT